MRISRDERLNHADFRDKYGLSALNFLDVESKVCIKHDVLYEKMDGDKKVDGHKNLN